MAILVDKNGLPYLIGDNIIEEPISTNIIFDNLRSLARSLSQLSGINRTNLGAVQSTIQNTNSTFNVFAVVSHQENSESLVGTASSNGKVNFTKENFSYATSSSNRLSTGKNISNMSGGINSSLPEIDGKPWMGCAVYDGGSNGFMGILLWVFMNDIISSTGSVISGTATITRASDIFYPSNMGALSRYKRIHQVVIGPGGGISASNVTGDGGWIFSSNQNSTTLGYNQINRFSSDDGIWAMKIGGKVDGDKGPGYRETGGYGFGNYNSSDFTSLLYWNGTLVSSTNYIGFVFTGDA
jgi:hypothetical protein